MHTFSRPDIDLARLASVDGIFALAPDPHVHLVVPTQQQLPDEVPTPLEPTVPDLPPEPPAPTPDPGPAIPVTPDPAPPSEPTHPDAPAPTAMTHDALLRYSRG